MSLSVCVAGVTGWTGRAVAGGVLGADDLRLTSGVSRSAAGTDLGRAWGGEDNGVPVFATVSEALDGVDVLIDFTSADAVRSHVLDAIATGVSVVVGTSGLAAADYAEIDENARQQNVGVVAAGNFSLTAALAQAAALLAAKYLPSWEIIDYASAGKPDAPSGTAMELADRLAEVRAPHVEVPVGATFGRPDTRGATVSGTQVHSVRLPGFVLSFEAVFGLPDERLVIRHDAGASAEPYVAGTLLAARAAPQRVGLTRGLDRLLVEA
jgi:4-hydroxy-tetrahydrodipicolinate reductase